MFQHLDLPKLLVIHVNTNIKKLIELHLTSKEQLPSISYSYCFQISKKMMEDGSLQF